MTEYAAPVGAPIWFDLMSSEPARAVDFYGSIFGWEVEAPPQQEFGGYQNFTHNGRRIAGLGPAMDGGVPNVWSVYLRTDDSAATQAAVEKAGGSVMVPPMPVGDMGTMSVATDSAGAVIGFWEKGSHVGFTEWGVHGAPYWFESQSKEYAKSLEFYPAVVGARADPVGTGGDPDAIGPDEYAQLFFGETAYAGIMNSVKVFPPEVPSFWQVYITVDDVAATIKQVESLGGTILMPGEDTPFGTLGAFQDPLGAQICVAHPPAGM
ncbi:VOC family protein [Gordonia soli]|uniref:VOC domain-containing protein n=1 Tax=Gordonia soli NBRC 108243 TaxID=1223545 RepID=M0QJ46_9ACTN|nr:VOC family protein [Gordonia soli]GAC68464.1 hypothetical protein GS4_15_01140 [Gordonia soli NBRC 108243]